MSFLKQLFDQVNMRDGGKTFNNPTGNSGAKAGTPPSVMPSAVQASQLSDFFNRPRGIVAGPVANHQPMQPFGVGQEDDYTPSEALHQTGYINPQTTPHGYFSQGGIPDPKRYPFQF
jgi:hypothetical protein